MDSVVFMMFHGGTLTYFIVIIFQFYLLHIIFAKHLVKLNPIKLVIYSLIITTLFWAMRNFIPHQNQFILIGCGKEKAG